MTGSKSTRPFVVSFYRKRRLVGRPRHYAHVSTAVPRCIERLLFAGSPGDVLEIAHSEYGFQVATIKVHVGGKFSINVARTLTEAQEKSNVINP